MRPNPTPRDRAVALDMLPEDQQDAISVHLTACKVRDARLAGDMGDADACLVLAMLKTGAHWESERWG